MPTITSTYSDPARRQQNNLAMFQAIGSLASTVAGGVQQYQQQQAQQQQMQQQQKMNNIGTGLQMYNEGFKTNNNEMIQKSMTDYLGFSKESAEMATTRMDTYRSEDNLKKIAAYENVGNIFSGKFRDTSGTLKDIGKNDTLKLLVPTLAQTDIDPKDWGKLVNTMGGVKAYQEADSMFNQVTNQELMNLSAAVEKDPSLDVSEQVQAIGTRMAIMKTKTWAGLYGKSIPADTFKTLESKLDFFDAQRKQAQGFTLTPQEDKLLNESTRAEGKYQASLALNKAKINELETTTKKVKAETSLVQQKRDMAALNVLNKKSELETGKPLSPKDKTSIITSFAKARESAQLLLGNELTKEIGQKQLADLNAQEAEILGKSPIQPSEATAKISDDDRKAIDFYNVADEKQKAKIRKQDWWNEFNSQYGEYLK